MSYALLLGAISFLVIVPWGTPLIRWLKTHGIGKRIREDGPGTHHAKMGTPTMGGLLILIPMTLVTIILHIMGRYSMLPLLGTSIAFGVLGTLDDLQGLTHGRNAPLAPQRGSVAPGGILARHMILYQTGIALVAASILYSALDLRGIAIPGVDKVADLGPWYIPLATFVIVATANGVNLTDGLDGLAGGTAAIAFVAYGIIAHLQEQGYLAAFCFAMTGALMAFLWYNAYPAQVIMGGIGSLSLGATLAVVALMTQQWLLLPVIGAVFVAVTLSVVLQVGYFKYTKRRYGQGRRIFKMAPLHHHFELLGWSQVQVTQRFWSVAILAAMLGVALAIW